MSRVLVGNEESVRAVTPQAGKKIKWNVLDRNPKSFRAGVWLVTSLLTSRCADV